MKKKNQASASLEELAAESDALALDIAERVSVLPRNRLLDRAWWRNCLKVCPDRDEDGKVPLETLAREDVVEIRLIEYLQTVIAAVPAVPDESVEVSAHDWQSLLDTIRAFFEVQHQYALARSEAIWPDPMGSQEFRLPLMGILGSRWIHMHGRRYPVHWRAYYEDMFLSLDAPLQEAFGVTAQELVDELMELHHALTYGPYDAMFRLVELEALEAAQDCDALTESARIAIRVEANELRRRMINFELFELERLCNLPEGLLRGLTWRAGGDSDFYGPGEMRGWILRQWPTFRRPLIEIKGRRFCYDQHLLADRVFGAIRRSVHETGAAAAAAWDKVQGQLAEQAAMKYLTRMLPHAAVYKNVYFSWRGEKFECDGVILCDDRLLIVEVKGRKVSERSPVLEFDRYLGSVREVAEEPVEQGKRLRDALDGQGMVNLFDGPGRRTRRKLVRLDRADFRRVYVIAVSLERVVEAASQFQNLNHLGVGVDDVDSWVVSVDDLRICADVFRDRTVFEHYLEQRVQAGACAQLWTLDETDHIAAYALDSAYGRVVAKKGAQKAVDLIVGGMEGLDIDQHFKSVAYDQILPTLSMPRVQGVVGQMLRWLMKSDEARHRDVVWFLLDLGAETQIHLGNAIEAEVLRQGDEEVVHPIAIDGAYGGVCVFCWSDAVGGRNPGLPRYHTQTALTLRGEDRRMALEVWIGDDLVVERVQGEWVGKPGPGPRLEAVTIEAEELRKERLKRAVAEQRAVRASFGKGIGRRVGRNEPCPCASGEKYKRCCLNRRGD